MHTGCWVLNALVSSWIVAKEIGSELDMVESSGTPPRTLFISISRLRLSTPPAADADMVFDVRAKTLFVFGKGFFIYSCHFTMQSSV